MRVAYYVFEAGFFESRHGREECAIKILTEGTEVDWIFLFNRVGTWRVYESEKSSSEHWLPLFYLKVLTL